MRRGSRSLVEMALAREPRAPTGRGQVHQEAVKEVLKHGSRYDST